MDAALGKLARLRRYIKSVQAKDPRLAEESRDLGGDEEELTEAVPSPEALERSIEQESIVMRRERPVLAIRDNITKPVFIDEVDSEIWGKRLKNARARDPSWTPSCVMRMNLEQ